MSRFLKLVSKYNHILNEYQVEDANAALGSQDPNAQAQDPNAAQQKTTREVPADTKSALPSLSNDEIRRLLEFAKAYVIQNKANFTDVEVLTNLLNKNSDDEVNKSAKEFISKVGSYEFVKDGDGEA